MSKIKGFFFFFSEDTLPFCITISMFSLLVLAKKKIAKLSIYKMVADVGKSDQLHYQPESSGVLDDAEQAVWCKCYVLY